MLGILYPVINENNGDFTESPRSAGVFTKDQAELKDYSHERTSTTVGVTRNSVGYSMGDGVTGGLEFTLNPTLSGPVWASVHLLKDDNLSGSGFKARFVRSPTLDSDDPGAVNRNRGGNQVWKFSNVANQTEFELVISSAAAGDIYQCQLVEMDNLTDPSDVYIALGQSNMAATTNSTDIDFNQDSWIDKRLLYASGATNTSYGVTLGSIEALRAPLQAASESSNIIVNTGFSSGVSPAISFAQSFLPNISSGRNLCIIQGAVTGTTLIGTDTQWSTTGVAYAHATSVISTAMSNLPTGSKIKGVLWCQGESDQGFDLTTYPSAWATMRSAFESVWNTAGWTDTSQIPWVIATTPSDSTLVNASSLIQMQLNMDKDSGHPYSQTLVKTVESGPGVEEDGVHALAYRQRLTGNQMAQAMKDLV